MREIVPPNRKSDKPIVVVSRGAKGRKRQCREAPARQIDMTRCAWILLMLQLATAPLRADDCTGQVGPIDEALLGLDWYRLRPGEYPILPLEGITVSVLDCGEDCPDPVRTDPAGRFRFPDTASPVRLRFDPPECAGSDPECEPLEPREVECVRSPHGCRREVACRDRGHHAALHAIRRRRSLRQARRRDTGCSWRRWHSRHTRCVVERPPWLASLPGNVNLHPCVDARVRAAASTRLLAGESRGQRMGAARKRAAGIRRGPQPHGQPRHSVGHENRSQSASIWRTPLDLRVSRSPRPRTESTARHQGWAPFRTSRVGQRRPTGPPSMFSARLAATKPERAAACGLSALGQVV